MLKAITLYEPWASLMAIGAKRNETRPCRINHRGDIAIHAAKTEYDTPGVLDPYVGKAFRERGQSPTPATMGSIVAVVDLWDVQPAEQFGIRNLGKPIELTEEEYLFGNYIYGCGRWIYRTRTLRRLAQPVPCRGSGTLGWTVPQEVEALVRQQLPKVLRLRCCSCGEPAPAVKQWSNRDDGYGICAKCWPIWVAKDGLESATQCCGRPGVHHSI